MKKFLSILLASLMVLAMMAPAMASSTTPTFQITAPDNGHTYEVLQIFKGDFSDGKLSNIKWGANSTGSVDSLVEKTTIDALKAVADKDDATKLATILPMVNTASSAVATVTNGSPATVEAGYYLIRDVVSSLPDNETASLYVVQVVNSIEIQPKGGKVEFKKQIKDTNDSTGETSDWQDSADYDIGDDVPFMMTGKVDSNYARYTKYYFCFKDTMETSLTSNVKTASDIVVKIDGTEVTSGFTVKNVSDQHFEVEFADLKQIASVAAGSVITVEYSAKLNDTAKFGAEGNMNKGSLVYSNNPNVDQEGNQSEETDETPEDAVIVFTYKVQVDKKDGNQQPLAGAEFKLEKIAKDGTPTEIAVVKTNEGKTFTFAGLDDGQYRLTETVTPAGYNTIAPIVFTVTATHSETADMIDFESDIRETVLTQLNGTKDATTTGEFSITFDKATGLGTTTVINLSGAELPTTGGIGTTLFYLFGGLMTAGSALMLVVRRRAEAEEE